MVVPMVPMAAEIGAAQVGFPGLEVTDSSYGGSYGSYGCRGRRCPGRFSRPGSYGWFLWFPMFSMAAQVGIPGLIVMDRMSIHVLDEEQLAPLRVH